jgi:uncharacterized protein
MINYRRCISCRQLIDRQLLWRVVRLHPQRLVQLDRGMGRSAYLCPAADCLAMAQKKNRLSRSLKVPVPETIYQQLIDRLAR